MKQGYSLSCHFSRSFYSNVCIYFLPDPHTFRQLSTQIIAICAFTLRYFVLCFLYIGNGEVFALTLKDIAGKANVSISTVSRVLNSNTTNAASREVQELIWKIAREGGYLPNKEAQALKNARKAASEKAVRSIYCLVACSPAEVRDDPFFTQAISSVEHEALQNNYVLEYTFFAGNSESDLTMRLMQNASSDRLIIIGRFTPELFTRLRQNFKKIVYLGWNDLEVECDGVICDGYLAVQEGIRHLYGLGHRRIGFIGAHRNEARFRGYLKAMELLGLPLEEKNIVSKSALSFESGYLGLEQLLTQGMDATALFCANDTTAIGALRACKNHGICVPKDLSVMGMNNIETVQYISPMLTTINIPLTEMGRVATRTLVDRINGGHSLPQKIMLPFHIVSRESCTPPPPAAETA